MRLVYIAIKGQPGKVYEEKDVDSMRVEMKGGKENREEEESWDSVWVLNEKFFFGRPIKNYFLPCTMGLSPIFGLAPFIRVGTGMHYPFFTGWWSTSHKLLHLPLPFSSHRPCSIFSFSPYGPTFSPPYPLLQTKTCDVYYNSVCGGGFDTLKQHKLHLYVQSANSLIIHMQSHLCIRTAQPQRFQR